MTAKEKSKAHRVAQVIRIAERINKLNRDNPEAARKAARYFAFWLKAMNDTQQKEVA